MHPSGLMLPPGEPGGHFCSFCGSEVPSRRKAVQGGTAGGRAQVMGASPPSSQQWETRVEVEGQDLCPKGSLPASVTPTARLHPCGGPRRESASLGLGGPLRGGACGQRPAASCSSDLTRSRESCRSLGPGPSSCPQRAQAARPLRSGTREGPQAQPPPPPTHMGVDLDGGDVRLLVYVLDGGLVGVPVLQLHLELLPA